MVKYSILIPVYNVEVYLRECLDSACKQDFANEEYEIVITDDGSTDGSSSICDEYAKKYDNLKVIHQDNQGLMMARRTGVLNSTGQYLLFMDSDDYVDADMLNIIDSVVEEEKPDFLMHSYYNTYKNVEKECKITAEKKEILDKKSFMTRFAKDSGLNSIVCKVVKRELLFDHIDEIYRDVNIAEDMLQTIYLTKYSDRIVLVDAMPYHYRIQGASMIHQMGFESIEQKLETYEMVKSVVEDILKKSNWSDKDKSTIEGLFEANVLNGCMESLYRYNVTCKKMETDRLDWLMNLPIIRSTPKKSISECLPLYNRIRLSLLQKRQYKFLRLIDKMLRFVQLLQERCEGVEWF